MEITFFSEDPYEYHNIAKENPAMVLKMMKRLKEYEASMIPPNVGPDTSNGDPVYFNGTFSPGWCKSEPSAMIDQVDVDIEILS